MKTTARTDHYAPITAAIIEQLEAGVRPWVRSWASTTPLSRPIRSNGEAYRGINTLLLWLATAKRGFESPYWLTYRQAAAEGGQVRRGEQATTIVFFSTIVKPNEENNDTEEPADVIPFLRTYSVFNATQIDRLPERFFPEAPKPTGPSYDHVRNERVERFFRNTGMAIAHGGDFPHFSTVGDRVQMPPLSAFASVNDYYAVLAHEAIHWVGHPLRQPLRYPLKASRRSNYAREELTAELGAAFLCADLGLSLTPRPDHGQYLSIWLEVLRHDKRALFQAAAMAQKAVDYLHSLQTAAGLANLVRAV